MWIEPRKRLISNIWLDLGIVYVRLPCLWEQSSDTASFKASEIEKADVVNARAKHFPDKGFELSPSRARLERPSFPTQAP
jgi:hypothetical protein